MSGDQIVVSTSGEMEEGGGGGSQLQEGDSASDNVDSTSDLQRDEETDSNLTKEDNGGCSSEKDISSSADYQLKKQGSSSNAENTFAQPMMLPPQFAAPKASSSAGGGGVSSSADSSSSSARKASTSSGGVQPQKISKEKLEKYNAILASLNYHPPSNASTCADPRYNLEVLKNGTIVDSVKFSGEDNKGYYIVGRVPGCDILAENPTVSRLHAVLQFVKGSGDMEKSEGEGSNGSENGYYDNPQEAGLYLYDLKSTHGTFINKNQVFPHKYYRVHVGHVLKFGSSQRMYIVGGPSEDEEEESDKSVTELMNERLRKDLERKRLEEEEQLKRNPTGMPVARNVEVEGIDWGMGEDADEESDMRINPFAMDYDACELTLDNPKKTLKSWFDREGHDLEYEVKEKGNGQFVCRIGLPLDGPTDAPVYAESEVKGKKKEAALDAAMKACQILDSHGLLRTSNQESRKRKEKRLDEDYYSSDEDTFLDRTGTVEKKREKRMRMAGKVEEKVETYESLCSKYSQLETEIAEIQSKMNKSQDIQKKAKTGDDDDEVDVDDYLKLLKSGVFDVKKLRSRLKEATEEMQRTKKLMDITKPAELPSYLQTAPKDLKKNIPPPSATTSVAAPEPEDAPKIAQVEADVEIEVSESKPTSSLAPPKQLQQKRQLFGPMKPSSSGSSAATAPPQQKLFGLIKPSSLASLKQQGLRLPANDRNVRLPTPPDSNELEEEEEESSSEDEESKKPPGENNEEGATSSTAVVQKNKKKRQRYRNQGKKGNKQDGEEYDHNDLNYTTWVPPTNQSGDGRTSLNEKLGY